jgi:hypothetical protein
MASATTLIGLGMPAELASATADGVFSGTVTPTGQVVATAAGIRTKQAINNVGDTTPSAAELTTSFGAPATVGAGFIGIVKDADADTNCFIVLSNGTSYFYHKFTKAT